MRHLKEHWLPIFLILCGVLDQATDTIAELVTQLGLPLYVNSIVKIVIIVIGGIKLYISQPNKLNNE